MLKIPAGPELNMLVAEYVMEWRPDPNRCAVCGWPLGGSYCTRDSCSMRPAPARRYDAPPDYSHDWNLIKPIAEKLRGENFELRTNMSMTGYGATFYADWETGAISGITVTSYADDLAHAVCLAALQAKGYKP